MEYRRVGESGLRVSSLSIGAWLTFGSSVDEDSSADIIRAAVEGGINFIDTADIYARGRAETVVGKAIADFERHHLVLASKVFWPMSDDPNDRGLSRKHIMESVEGTLRRLGTDYLDIYFCHRFDGETPLRETIRAMDDLIHQGKILYWGTSVWSGEQIKQAQEICDEGGYYRPIVEQPKYNLLAREIEEDVLPAARKYGMGIVAWSPLAGGVLTGKYNEGIPEDSRAARTNWLENTLSDNNLDRVRKLSRIAEELGVTGAQLALAWTIAQTGITSAITGATKPKHVARNLRAADIVLDRGTLATLNAIFGEKSLHTET